MVDFAEENKRDIDIAIDQGNEIIRLEEWIDLDAEEIMKLYDRL